MTEEQIIAEAMRCYYNRDPEALQAFLKRVAGKIDELDNLVMELSERLE